LIASLADESTITNKECFNEKTRPFGKDDAVITEPSGSDRMQHSTKLINGDVEIFGSVGSSHPVATARGSAMTLHYAFGLVAMAG
jgi:hypothetical protein